jgi:hypothetical protein
MTGRKSKPICGGEISQERRLSIGRYSLALRGLVLEGHDATSFLVAQVAQLLYGPKKATLILKALFFLFKFVSPQSFPSRVASAHRKRNYMSNESLARFNRETWLIEAEVLAGSGRLLRITLGLTGVELTGKGLRRIGI